MIDVQLGPPPVAAGRGGSAPAGDAGGDSATGTLVETGDGGFVAVLDGHAAPGSPDATGEAQTQTAAGPLTGKLPTEVVADADDPTTTTAPAGDAAAIAVAVAGAAAVAVQAAPAAPAPTAGAAGANTSAPAAPAPPIPGIVPATLDAQGRVVPVPPATPAAAEQEPAPAPAAGATAAAGPGASGDQPAPAARITLTLTRAEPAPAAAPATGAPSAPAMPAPPAAPAHPASVDAPAPARPAGEPAPAAPVALVVGAPAQPPTVADPLGSRGGAGLTTPHELARELGTRLQMAVREGGRELLVNLRPPELGHVTIRVTMSDGVLQAQIVADRPEAARMLQQSLTHLGSALGDLGYSLENLDVAYGGQDPPDATPSQGDTGAPVRGEVLEVDGTPAATVPSTTAARLPARLDLLA